MWSRPSLDGSRAIPAGALVLASGHFEAQDGKLFLNGNPFFMVAALDQDFYPETVHTPDFR